jgi:hypothetical protein
MSRQEETVLCLHPDPTKSGRRISQVKYEAVKNAILQAISQNDAGVYFKDLDSEVARRLPRATLEKLGSVSWYTVSVKLDLEARGLIERIPGSGLQRLRLKR